MVDIRKKFPGILNYCVNKLCFIFILTPFFIYEKNIFYSSV